MQESASSAPPRANSDTISQKSSACASLSSSFTDSPVAKNPSNIAVDSVDSLSTSLHLSTAMESEMEMSEDEQLLMAIALSLNDSSVSARELTDVSIDTKADSQFNAPIATTKILTSIDIPSSLTPTSSSGALDKMSPSPSRLLEKIAIALSTPPGQAIHSQFESIDDTTVDEKDILKDGLDHVEEVNISISDSEKAIHVESTSKTLSSDLSNVSLLKDDPNQSSHES